MDVFSADWLGICRRIVAAQREIFDEVRGIEARTVYEGVGEGGDHTLAIDRRCEDVGLRRARGAGRARAPRSSPSPRSAARSASATAARPGS